MAATAHLRVRSRPAVTDPKEFETILRFSIRHIFGDLERISHDVIATKGDDDDHTDNKDTAVMMVQCNAASLGQVRAALTVVTPPPYLKDTLYSFDVLDVKID
jgi:RNase P/RNase MRP subunit POP5